MSYTKVSQLNKKRKNSVNERKSLIKKLDDIIRAIVRHRDTQCCSCHKRLEDNMQVSHFVGRRHYALRWDLRNVAGSCPGCNLAHNHNPQPYSNFMLKKYGNDIFDRLDQQLKEHTKFKTSDLKVLLEELTRQVK